MPSLEWNLRRWGGTHDWSRGGEEWSDGIGGSEGQWFWWLYPRIHRFLPARRVLEIATGYGRWTQYLLEHADDYVGIDLAPNCIDAVKSRFESSGKFHAFVNDGYTLPTVADGSVDFVFSFGSLVHCEADVVESYVREIGRVLGGDGVAFLHHSNAGDPHFKYEDSHNFARSVSAATVAKMAADCGLTATLQETMSWGTPVDQHLSALTVLVRPRSRFDGEPRRFENDRLDGDAAYVERMSRLWFSDGPATPR
jgi:SAM-dependent methyltransferase